MTDDALRFDLAHWNAYNTVQAQSTRPVRALCRTVLDLAGPGDGRTAVDLGAGAGFETAAMLAAGWRVTAIEPATDTALTAVPDDDRLLDGLDVLDLDEKDREDRTTRGTKHWHVFEAIARRTA